MSFSKAFTVEGEDVYFSNPAALSEDEWKTLWKESEKIGYCFRNVQEYRAYYTELNDELSSKGEKPLALRNDQKDSIAQYIGIPTSNHAFMEKADTYIKEAEEYFKFLEVPTYICMPATSHRMAYGLISMTHRDILIAEPWTIGM